MATDLEGFSVTLGLYAAICLLVVLFFGFLRRSKVAYKFYNPARFEEHRGKRRPKPLPPSIFGWITEMYRYGQAEVATLAGWDAAMFIRIFAFGSELFFFLTAWCIIVVLPTNISGNQVAYLIGTNAVPTSNFTYWVSPPPPPLPPGTEPPPASGPPTIIRAPQFYDSNVPPAPAGIVWWKYKSGVPPLPDPIDFFNGSSQFSRYGWKYDANYVANDYTFSNLDITSMTNVSNGDRRLWVHLVSIWVISLYLLKLLWRYNEEAVALRMQFLTQPDRKAEACTILVRDVPGIYYGTVADRVERTVLRFLPAFVKRRIVMASMQEWGGKTLQVAGKGVDMTASLSQVIIPDAGVLTRPDRGAPTPARVADSDVPTTPTAGDEIGPGESAPGALPTELDAEADAVRQLQSGCSTSQLVKAQFNDMYDSKVGRVHVCYDTRELDKLVAEFTSDSTKLQDLLDDYISKDRRRRRVRRQKITIVGPQYGQWGIQKFGTKPARVDALSFYQERLQALLQEVEQAQTRCLPPNEHVMPAAFVTFTQRRCEVTAAASMIHHQRTAWITGPAPGPEEIIWKNLGWRKWERSIRFVLVWGLFFLIVAFYIPLVSAIQALLQIDKLTALPGVRQVTQLPLVSSVVASFLPSLVLRVFLLVLPYLLAYLGSVEGLVSRSAVTFSVVGKLFTFQFLTVFLTSLIAGTIMSQLQQVAQNPSSLVTSLGAAAPQAATFFMLYIMLTALVAKPFQFLRLPGLVLLHIQTWLASTERAKARLWEDQYVDYGWEIPDASVTILLGLVFCVIQPLIAPIALLYFLVNSALYKYQLIYVHKPRFESGGLVWGQFFDHVMLAAFVFQIVMLGLMGLKGGVAQSLLLLPLPFLWAAMWMASHDLFRRPMQMLSLRAATDMDKHDNAQPQEEEDGQVPEPYQHPVFQIDESKLKDLLAEAQRVEEVLNSPDYMPGLLATVAAEPESDVELGDQMSSRGSAADQMQEMLLAPSRRSTVS